MPRLVKGAKWTFGWVVVGPGRKVRIPPQAWQEYGFLAGGEALFVRGSRRSGGFGVSTPELMSAAHEQIAGNLLGQGQFDPDGGLALPPEIEAQPGERLLTVRGSCYALAMVARGPIYEEALKHAELEIF